MKFKNRTRMICVPLWVSGAPPLKVGRRTQVAPESEDSDSSESSSHALEAAPVQTQPAPAPIRFQWRPCEQLSVPLGVKPEGRFRVRIGIHRRGDEVGHTSSCMLPSALPQTFKEIDSSLKAGHAFLGTLLQQERQLFGPEGTSAGLARAQKAMSRCFDWGRLVSSTPTTNDLRAFAELNSLLLLFYSFYVNYTTFIIFFYKLLIYSLFRAFMLKPLS